MRLLTSKRGALDRALHSTLALLLALAGLGSACTRVGYTDRTFAKLAGAELTLQSLPPIIRGGVSRTIAFQVQTGSATPVAELFVQLSRDDGTNWNDEMKLPADAREFRWNVPEETIPKAKLRVIAKDTRQNTVVAASNGFSIRTKLPNLTLAHPIGAVTSPERKLDWDGECETGVPITLTIGGVKQPSISCIDGKWSYHAEVPRDTKSDFLFKQTITDEIESQVGQTWISDATPPSIVRMTAKWERNDGDRPLLARLSFKASDNLTHVTRFCARQLPQPELEKPKARDLEGCWIPARETGPTTAEFQDYQVAVPIAQQDWPLYVWIEDEAQNVGETRVDSQECVAWQNEPTVVGPSRFGRSFQWLVLNANDYSAVSYRIGTQPEIALPSDHVVAIQIDSPLHSSLQIKGVDACSHPRIKTLPVDVDVIPTPAPTPSPTPPPCVDPTPEPAPTATQNGPLPAQSAPHPRAPGCQNGSPLLIGDCNGSGDIDNASSDEIGKLNDPRAAGLTKCAPGLKAWSYDLFSPGREPWTASDGSPGYKCLRIQCAPTGAYTIDRTGASCCSGRLDAAVARCIDE